MLGEMIKTARRERRLTQDDFASKLGINRATLSKYESNIIEPSASMIALIAKELNVPISFLFGETKGQVLSFDFQHHILAIVRERVELLLGNFDPEDLYAAYGTYNAYEVFEELFDPVLPVSLEMVENTAKELGVSTEYLLGAVEDPDDTLENIQDRKALWSAIDAFSALNSAGQSKAIERIKELSEVPRFKKQNPPQDPENPETE